MKKVFCICYDFPPAITTTANRIGKIMKYLQTDWQIEVLTKVENGYLGEAVSVHSVKPWYPQSLIEWMSKVKLEKFLHWFMPFGGEQAFFWVFPALLRARKLIKQQKPDVIVVLMMPYATGIIGILLKWLTGIPLVFNFDDSPTCTDMGGSSFPSWFHYRMTVWMEDFYVRQADAVIYVSKRNLERVQKRQPQQHQAKFHLVRYGADRIDFIPSKILSKENFFQITYIGFMAGWFEFYHTQEEQTLFRKLYQAWLNFGRYKILDLDVRSSSPIFVAKAVQQVLAENPEWQGKIRIDIYGNFYPDYVIEKVLKNENITNIVNVFQALPIQEAMKIACQSDLLFLTLPARPAGVEPGGRISAKTYEYLMTDRPILAAVSPGENREYLEDKPGVWLVEPTDISAMGKAINELASAKFSGELMIFDRTAFHSELSYENRAKEFAAVLASVIV